MSERGLTRELLQDRVIVSGVAGEDPFLRTDRVRRDGGLERAEPGWNRIRLRRPNFPVMEVFEQRPQVLPRNLARPDDFGVINICSVVNPFMMNVVVSRITNQYKMAAGFGLQLSGDLRAIRIPLHEWMP